MLERLDRAWRIVATGLAFASFGAGGLALRVLVFPLLGLLLRNAERRQRICKTVVGQTFRLFLWWMRVLGVIRYEIRHAERLRRGGLLVVANHPTLIDVVFLIALTPRADCVVKAGLARNAFTRGPVRATGYLCNDGGADLVDACIGSLRKGNNLVIFPEGTRTVPGAVPRLQRGAANVAVRGGFALTPVVIQCDPPTLAKGEKWYRVPARRPHFVIDVREDVPLSHWVEPGLDDALAVRRLTEALSRFFTMEVRREGA